MVSGGKGVLALALSLMLLVSPVLGKDYGTVTTLKIEVSPGEASSKSIEITKCEIESGCSGSITLSVVSDVKDWIALSPARFDLSGSNYMKSYPANVTVSPPSGTQPGKYSARVVVETGADIWSYALNITVKNPDGKITMSSEPGGALLYIDGVYRGTTPLLLDMPAGSHVLNISKDGYEEWTRKIVVNPGEVKNVSAALIQKGGMMENLGLLLVVIAVVLVGGVAAFIYGGPAIGKIKPRAFQAGRRIVKLKTMYRGSTAGIKPKLVQARGGIAKLRNARSESFKQSISVGMGEVSQMKNLPRSPEKKITPTPELKSGFDVKGYTAGAEGEGSEVMAAEEGKGVHYALDVHLGDEKEPAEVEEEALKAELISLKEELEHIRADIEETGKNSETKISAVEQIMAYIGDRVESLKSDLDSITGRSFEAKAFQGAPKEFETLKSEVLGLKKLVDEIMKNLGAVKKSFDDKIRQLSDEIGKMSIGATPLTATKIEGVESNRLLEELGVMRKEIGELKREVANIYGSEMTGAKGMETLRSAFVSREEFTELSEGISSVAPAIRDELAEIRNAIVSLRQRMPQASSPQQELHLRRR